MGGTSTDVSRYAGSYELTFENITGGVPIQVFFFKNPPGRGAAKEK